VLLTGGSSSYINPSPAFNHLEVERDDTSIKVYANGQFLKSITDGSYTGLRYVGLIVGGSPEDVRFDNFVVYPVSCGGTSK
jgi:hypothetical protein